MKEIDLNNWELKEQYNLFSKYAHPYYGITTKIDITKVYNFAKLNNISFYFCLGHIVNTAIRKVEELNIRLVNNKLIVDNHNLVSFTCKNKDERKYRFVDVPYQEDIVEFCNTARKLEKEQTTLFSTAGLGLDYSVFISCVPWINFSMVSNPQTDDITDFVPRIIWDKILEENGRKFLNIGVEVNHAVADGYAISQLILNIANLIENLK